METQKDRQTINPRRIERDCQTDREVDKQREWDRDWQGGSQTNREEKSNITREK